MTSAALPTFLEMQTSVYAVLRDAEQAFIVQAEVKEWLNRGLLDLNARLRLKQLLVEGTTDADGHIVLPDDFIENISLWIGDVFVNFVDDTTFESWAIPNTATPYVTLGRVFDNEIETYPAQIEQDYAWRFVKRPTELVNNSDLPTDLTPELADRVIDYARAEAKLKEAEHQEYEYYRRRYEEGLPGRPRVAHRMRPASPSMIPEPGPFG